MIQSNDFFTQRRAAIAEQVRGILAVRGPLRPDQRKTLDSLLNEANDLEHGVSAEFARRENAAFGAWLRGAPVDRNVLRVDATRRFDMRDLGEFGTQGTGVATGAGVLVPVGFEGDLIAAMKYYGPMADETFITPLPTPTGQNLSVPTEDDRNSTAIVIPESGQIPAQDVPVFGQSIFGATKYSSGVVKVSNELQTDSGIPVDQFLLKAFAVRFGRKLNADNTTGANGFVTTAISRGAVTASENFNTLGLDDFSNLESALDPAYRNGAVWQVHSNTLAKLREAKDNVGARLFIDLHQGVKGGVKADHSGGGKIDHSIGSSCLL